MFPKDGVLFSPSAMLIAERRPAVIVRAPAKVNLFLEVLAKRPDGYHEIATLMVAVRLFDTLVFQEESGDHLELVCNRPDLTTGPDNLILKAARKLQEKTGCQRGARIRLVKRIPMAAGLAGGSTDAAATLAGLNRLWRLGCSDQDLAQWSGEIGSDVPFFFHTPAAWCTGRGEKVTAVAVGRPLDLVLVCPQVGLATASVYRGVTVPESPLQGEEICQALASGDVEALGRHLHNRLQPVAERLCPVVAQWYERLRSFQPAGQLMSGSGSSLFAVCRHRREAEALARQLRPGADEEQAKVYLVRSCS
jgi:4-diphosphocytidyl-2-C-methyl-D-erythritol kinase